MIAVLNCKQKFDSSWTCECFVIVLELVDASYKNLNTFLPAFLCLITPFTVER